MDVCVSVSVSVMPPLHHWCIKWARKILELDMWYNECVRSCVPMRHTQQEAYVPWTQMRSRCTTRYVTRSRTRTHKHSHTQTLLAKGRSGELKKQEAVEKYQHYSVTFWCCIFRCYFFVSVCKWKIERKRRRQQRQRRRNETQKEKIKKKCVSSRVYFQFKSRANAIAIYAMYRSIHVNK